VWRNASGRKRKRWAEILRLHAELRFTLVYVTHGQEEAPEISTRTIELVDRI
jgi:ABC-type sugar transport system ATPase subunit